MLLFSINHLASSLPSAVQSAKVAAIQYKSYNLPQSLIHTLLIPAQSHFSVTFALSPELDFLENFVHKYKAIAADKLWSFVEKNKSNVCPKNSKPEIAGAP